MWGDKVLRESQRCAGLSCGSCPAGANPSRRARGPITCSLLPGSSLHPWVSQCNEERAHRDHIWSEPWGRANTPCSALASPDSSVLPQALLTLHRAETCEISGNFPIEQQVTGICPCLEESQVQSQMPPRSPAQPGGLCSAALGG